MCAAIWVWNWMKAADSGGYLAEPFSPRRISRSFSSSLVVVVISSRAHSIVSTFLPQSPSGPSLCVGRFFLGTKREISPLLASASSSGGDWFFLLFLAICLVASLRSLVSALSSLLHAFSRRSYRSGSSLRSLRGDDEVSRHTAD